MLNIATKSKGQINGKDEQGQKRRDFQHKACGDLSVQAFASVSNHVLPLLCPIKLAVGSYHIHFSTNMIDVTAFVLP